MFTRSFQKTSAALVTMSPEEYYEHVGAKDPYMGAVGGALAGAAAGALKGKKGKRAASALKGAALGGATGVSTGYVAGKAVRGYQARRIRRLLEELRLKSSPGRHQHTAQDKEG